jgi:hypothetical protein
VVARHCWLTPVTVATQEAEIRRIMANSFVRSYLKKPFTKIGLVEWLKVKSHYRKKKKKNKKSKWC